jgi:hypothetical protein
MTGKKEYEEYIRGLPRSICPRCGLPNDDGEALEWCTCERDDDA